MEIKNDKLNEYILNFNDSVKRRNEVAEYYFTHGIRAAIDHFKISKQGIYSDVKGYKKFIGAYNLISNATSKKDFLNLTAKEVGPLFNNPRLLRFFDKDCKLKDFNFSTDGKTRREIGGWKSYCQYKEFVKSYFSNESQK